MKPDIWLIVFVSALLSLAIAPCPAGESKPAKAAQNEQASLGIRVDTNPLPELLVKHLQLEKGQGLLITNILKDGPADKAGIDQDDIIVAFEGKTVKGFGEFVEAVRQAGVGAAVNVEVIQKGVHKTITATLVGWPEKPVWKYEDKAAAAQPAAPKGRIFRMSPGQRHWQEIPDDQTPDMNEFFKYFSIPNPRHPEHFDNPGQPLDDESFREQLQDMRQRLDRIEKQYQEYRKNNPSSPDAPDADSDSGEDSGSDDSSSGNESEYL